MDQQQSDEQAFLAEIEASLRNVDDDSSSPPFLPFYKNVALFLKNEEKEDSQFCASVIKSLYSYRIKTLKNLKAVTDRDKVEFRAEIIKSGIPFATCNALYDEFVKDATAEKQQKQQQQQEGGEFVGGKPS